MAAGGLDVDLTLVGRAQAIEQELRGTTGLDRIRIVDAPHVIEMDEHATDSVRAKPDASINVGMRLVKSGEADAFVEAGKMGGGIGVDLFPCRFQTGADHGLGAALAIGARDVDRGGDGAFGVAEEAQQAMDAVKRQVDDLGVQGHHPFEDGIGGEGGHGVRSLRIRLRRVGRSVRP